MVVKLLTEHHLECLGLKGGYRGLSESTLVTMSNCWKSHATAQIYFTGQIFYQKCASILGEVLIFFIIVAVMSLPSEWDKNSSWVISENRPTCRILQKKRKHKHLNGGDLNLISPSLCPCSLSGKMIHYRSVSA